MYPEKMALKKDQVDLVTFPSRPLRYSGLSILHPSAR